MKAFCAVVILFAVGVLIWTFLYPPTETYVGSTGVRIRETKRFWFQELAAREQDGAHLRVNAEKQLLLVFACVTLVASSFALTCDGPVKRMIHRDNRPSVGALKVLLILGVLAFGVPFFYILSEIFAAQ